MSDIQPANMGKITITDPSLIFDSPIAQQLLKLAELAESKGKEYGNTHEKFGPVMTALFPEGIGLGTTDAWNRLGVVNMIVHKLMRYCHALDKDGKGHLDSARDLAVYGAILAEMTK